MMNMNRYIIAAVSLLLLSCSDKEQEKGSATDAVGYLSTVFETQNDSSFVDQAPTTKSVDEGGYLVKVKSIADDHYVLRSLKSNIADIIELPVGEYAVEVQFPANPLPVEFNQPIFAGATDENIVILQDEISTINTISSSVQNMKVTVEITPMIKELFEQYSVMVKSKDGMLVFNNATKDVGYFMPEQLQITFTGKRFETGEIIMIDFPGMITEVGAAYHHNIIINVGYEQAPTSKSTQDKYFDNNFNIAVQ